MVVYYGDDPEHFAKIQQTSDFAFRAKGLKVDLLRQILLEKLFYGENFDFRRYDHIWIPDDDIDFAPGLGPDAIFDAARKLKADLFQPAIMGPNVSKSWQATRHMPGNFARRVNVVEIMVPGYSGEMLEKGFLPALHACDFMTAGWGLNLHSVKIAETILRRQLRTYVIDAAPAIHTRPQDRPGNPSSAAGWWEVSMLPQTRTNKLREFEIIASASGIAHLSEEEAPAPLSPEAKSEYAALLSRFSQQKR